MVAIETRTWDELLASETGAGVIVVSVAGILSHPRKDRLGDPRTATVEHYEVVGKVVVIVTLNTLTGRHSGYVVGQGADIDWIDDAEKVAFYTAFDSHGIRIVADDGIKIMGTSPFDTRDEAIESARKIAGRLTGEG